MAFISTNVDLSNLSLLYLIENMIFISIVIIFIYTLGCLDLIPSGNFGFFYINVMINLDVNVIGLRST
jgi:hypothetical protein